MPTNPSPAQPPRPPRRTLGRGPGTGPRATGTPGERPPGPTPPDRETADRETADQEMADREVADRETADREVADREPADREVAPEAADRPEPAPEPAAARPADPDRAAPAEGRQTPPDPPATTRPEVDRPQAPGHAPAGRAVAEPARAEAERRAAGDAAADREAGRGGPQAPGGDADGVVATRHLAPGGGAGETARPGDAGRSVEPTGDAGGPAGPPGDAGGETPDGQGKFTVRLANFEGPFDLLLQLISKHKLDVTEVALSKVTDEFMAHIRAMGPDWDLDQTTEFLVVAATLLDLKAARLLPAAEVEDEADLALLEARDLLFARLLQYRAFKRVADILNDRLIAESRRYPRTVGLEPHHADLLPEVVISIGAEGFAKLAVKAMQPKPKPQVYVDHIHAPLVSVREQAEVVVARLRELGEASFTTLTDDAPDVLTVVARFLALLELYRERAVRLDQEEALGSLMVRWTGTEDRQPRVTDEFDQEEHQDGRERKPRPPTEEKEEGQT